MRTQNHSRKREAILEKIRSTKTHPTAEWVYGQLKSEIPDLSLATVYRNIHLFQERGDIISIATVKGKERFDGDIHSHAHFICKHCSAVVDVDEAPQSRAKKQLQSFGFEVERVDFIVHGTCKDCIKNKKEVERNEKNEKICM